MPAAKNKSKPKKEAPPEEAEAETPLAEKYGKRDENGETAVEREAPKKLKFAPSQSEVEPTEEPRASQWEPALRELFRERLIMTEDFGLTKGAIARYAETARQGPKHANAKKYKAAVEALEPVRHCFLDLMGTTIHHRKLRDEEGKFVFRDVPTGRRDREGRPITTQKHVTEERSKWGFREGPDLWVTGGKRPKARQVYDKINEHFYSFIQVCDFMRRATPLTFHGRRHPNPEFLKQAHEEAIDAEKNPARAEAMAFVRRYLPKEKGGDGMEHEWNGLD